MRKQTLIAKMKELHHDMKFCIGPNLQNYKDDYMAKWHLMLKLENYMTTPMEGYYYWDNIVKDYLAIDKCLTESLQYLETYRKVRNPHVNGRLHKVISQSHDFLVVMEEIFEFSPTFSEYSIVTCHPWVKCIHDTLSRILMAVQLVHEITKKYPTFKCKKK